MIKAIKQRRMKVDRICSTHGENTNAYRKIVGRPGRKRPLERSRRRWVDNIKTDLTGRMEWNGLIWIRLGTGKGLLSIW
jgi:hypothetical protein